MLQNAWSLSLASLAGSRGGRGILCSNNHSETPSSTVSGGMNGVVQGIHLNIVCGPPNPRGAAARGLDQMAIEPKQFSLDHIMQYRDIFHRDAWSQLGGQGSL